MSARMRDEGGGKPDDDAASGGDPLLRFRPVGRSALLVEVDGSEQAQAAYRLVRRLCDDAALALDRPQDVVPAARTVLLDGIADLLGWQQALTAHASATALPSADCGEGSTVVLSVRYDGPDLATVASQWGCEVDDVVRRHIEARFTVAFCGFAPGFAYCTSQVALPPVSRRDTPRASVPAGSVAMAGPYCGVYPRAMPGGWQLIGTTDAVLFDLGRADPALLRPGDEVRFQAVG